MKYSIRFLVAVLVCLPAMTLFGQGTTGQLSGTVTQDGAPLPGVTVTASSRNLQGDRTTVTNDSGGYTFGSLPPGAYTVRFELAGLRTVTKQQQVGLAQNVRVDADLQLATVSEAITVTASAPAVAETREVQSNYDSELIDELPVGRSLTAITNLAPGVTGGMNGPSISGGFSFDNLYTVNGAVVQENLRGQPHDLFIEDAIQETTVQTAGVSAEFGNFTGGVVNAITKSGGNEFSGSLRDTLVNPAWSAKSPDVWTLDSKQPGGIRRVPQKENESSLNQTYEATFGGRIIRDRLWFFFAGREAEVDAERVFGGGNSERFTFLTSQRRLEGKLTGSVTPRHSLVASYLEAPITSQNECQVVGCYDEMGLIPSSARAQEFRTANYNGVITNNFLLEARYSEKYFTFIDVGGTDHDRVTGTPIRLGAAGGRTTNESYFCGNCTPESRDNDAWGVKTTYFLGTGSMGTHNITAGYDKWHETRLSNNYQSPTDYVMWAGNSGIYAPKRVNGQTLISLAGGPTQTNEYLLHFPILASSLGSDLNTDALWINDRWDVSNRWAVNLGLRYDKNDSKDSAGNLIANDAKLSPRMGVSFDPFGNGRLRINASYGVYVGRLAETIAGAGSANGNPAVFAWYYRGPSIIDATPEDAMRRIWEWFDAQGGPQNMAPWTSNVPGTQRQIPDQLVSPNVAEIAVGVGSQLGRAFLRADYVSRDWRDFYAERRTLAIGTVTLPNGSIADKSLVGNTDALKRTYDGLTVQAGFRPSARINIGGNYTWSELRGNATLESVGSVVLTETAGEYYPEYLNFARNKPEGFLAGDQTHKVRAWGSIDFPTAIGNFNVSAIQSFDSGDAYSHTISVNPSLTIKNPGYRTPPQSVTYFLSDRGEFRFDNTTSTGLALNYNTNPSWLRGASFFVNADILNVFNEDSGSFNTDILSQTSSACIQTTGPDAGKRCATFNPFTDTPVEGVHYVKDARYGKPTSETIPLVNVGGLSFGGSFQTPRTYRGSFGIRF